MIKILVIFKNPLFILILLICALYYKFFLFGKIPIPADLLVGAYFPWLDHTFGYPTGVPVKNPLISDVFSQFFVWKYLAIDNFSKGVFPLWNIYSFSGTPLLANYHSAVLNPFNLLLLTPRYYGWGLYIFAQTLLAAVGMYFFAGIYIKNASAKIASSLVFSLSGLMTTWIEFGTGVYAAAMLPWILFSIAKFLMTSRYRYLLLFMSSLMTLYFSGHAQLTQYSTALVIIFLIFKKTQENVDIKKIILCILSIIFVWGIVSIQILPVLEFSKFTIRNTDIPILGINHDGLNNLTDLIRFIAPDFYGNPTTYNYWGEGSYHEQASFLGVLTLPLILYLISRRYKSRQILFWFILLIFSVFLAYKNPITAWFYNLKIPLLTYSNASRTFFITSLAAGILVGLALDVLNQEENVKKRFLPFVLVFTCLLMILLGVLSIILSNNLDPQLQTNLKVSLRNLIFPTSVLFFSLILLFIIRKKKLLIFAISCILFLDLGRYFLKYNPFVPQHIIFPETPIIKFLQQNSDYRYARSDQVIFPSNVNVHYQLKSAEGYDAMLTEDYARFFNVVNGNPYNNAVNRYVDLKNFKSPFVDALGIKYLLAVKRDEAGGIKGEILDYQILNTGYKKVFEDKSTVVLENPRAKKLVYFVPEIKSVNSKKDLIKQLETKNFNPTKTALILSNEKVDSDRIVGEISKINFEANKINFQTSSNYNNFIVIANGYNPGWKAYIDNTPVRVYQTNLALMGISIPKGDHSIRLIYYPDSFDLGWKISLISLFGLGLLTIYSIKKKIW